MPHAKAIYNGQTIAETSDFEFVEGNVYFPPASVNKSVLKPASNTSYCPWKGTASYYNIDVDGNVAEGAAWYYPSPISDRAAGLKDYVAFYKTKVQVVKED